MWKYLAGLCVVLILTNVGSVWKLMSVSDQNVELSRTLSAAEEARDQAEQSRGQCLNGWEQCQAVRVNLEGQIETLNRLVLRGQGVRAQ